MAVDRDFLSARSTRCAQLPSYSFVPPGIAGYTPAPADFGSLSQLDREDEAKKLLTEAGYGPGGKPLKIEIRYNTNANHQKVATAVADNWKELGGRGEPSELGREVALCLPAGGGTFDVARAGWTATMPTPRTSCSCASAPQDLQLSITTARRSTP